MVKYLTGPLILLFTATTILAGEIRYPQGPLVVGTTEGSNAYVFNRTTKNLTALIGGSAPYSLQSLESVGSRITRIGHSDVSGDFFLLDSINDAVVRIDDGTLTAGNTITSGIGTNPYEVVVTDQGVVFVSNRGSASVSTFAEAASTATERSVGTQPGPMAVYRTGGGFDYVYILDLFDGSVTRMIDNTFTTSTYTFSTHSRLADLAFSQDTQELFILDSEAHKLHVLDGTHMTLTDTLDTCSHPIQVAVNDSLDHIYVLCQQSERLRVYHQRQTLSTGGDAEIRRAFITDTDGVVTGNNNFTSATYGRFQSTDVGRVINITAGVNAGTYTISSVTAAGAAVVDTAFTAAGGSQNYRIYANNTISSATAGWSSSHIGTYVEITEGTQQGTYRITDVFQINGVDSVEVSTVSDLDTNETALDWEHHRGPTLLEDVSVGTYPIQMAFYDEDDGLVTTNLDQIYVLNRGSHNITIIEDQEFDPAAAGYDPLTDFSFTPASLDLTYRPYQMAVRHHDTRTLVRIYVTHYNDNRLSVVTPAASVQSTTSLVYPGEPHDIHYQLTTAQDELFVSHPDTNQVSVVDLDNSNRFSLVSTGTKPTTVKGNGSTRVYVLNESSDNVTAINSDTQAVVGTITVGDLPRDAEVDTAHNRLYVLNVADETVSDINIAADAHTTLATTSIGHNPRDLCLNTASQKVYVVNSSDDTVSVLDFSGGVPPTATTVTVGDGPVECSVDSGTGIVAVANYNAHTVSLINATNTVVATLSAQYAPKHVQIDGDNDILFIGAVQSKQVLVYDIATPASATLSETLDFDDIPGEMTFDSTSDAVYMLFSNCFQVAGIMPTNFGVETVSVGLQPSHIALRTSSTPSSVFVTNARDQSISTFSGVVPDVADLGSRDVPIKLASDTTNETVWAVNRNNGRITIIDTTASPPAVLSHLSSCREPVDIAITTNDRAWVACQASSQVGVYATDTNTLVDYVPVGARPMAIAANSTTTPIKVYSANSGGDSVTVINGGTNAVLSTVSVGTRPVALSVDTTADEVAVVNHASNSYSVIDNAQAVTTTEFGSGFQSPIDVAVNGAQGSFYASMHNLGGIWSTGATFTTSVNTSNRANGGYLAINTSTDKTYATFPYDDVVRIFDEDASTITDVSVGDYPTHMAINESLDKIYVLNKAGESISVVNDSEAVASTISLTTNSRPCSIISYDGTSDWIFVGLCATDQIVVINPATDTITTTLTLP